MQLVNAYGNKHNVVSNTIAGMNDQNIENARVSSDDLKSVYVTNMMVCTYYYKKVSYIVLWYYMLIMTEDYADFR